MKKLLLFCAVVAACSSAGAPPVPAAAPGGSRPTVAQLPVSPRADADAVAFLLSEEAQHSHVTADLEHLTDSIGPRLTGTPAARRANEWMASKLREYGMDDVTLEPWPFGIGWQRGPLTMRLLAPHERWINAVSWAWAPGTNGPLAGDVVFVDATTRAEFDRRFAGRLRGDWVLVGRQFPRWNPDAYTAADSLRIDSLRRAMRAPVTPEQRAFLQVRDSLLAAEGIAGRLRDGGKEFALLTMSGSPDDVSPFPQVVIANETYAEMLRDLEAGRHVRVEVNAVNTFGRDTLAQWNTVGAIRGSERPEQVVLVGAHLDSWDLGTGATDNGTGAIAVLEAARLLGALKQTGVRPRRSIRFVLFTGEEQGLYGSQYYVLEHKAELPNIQAILVLDNGSGRVTGVGLQGWDQLYDMWSAMMAAMPSLGPLAVRSEIKTGTDHLSFVAAGVPGFNYDQVPRGYDHTHHSQVDVFDHTVPADVQQAAAVMAVNALQLANLDSLLPRKRR